MSDRTVHGYTSGGDSIVRYDRAGKWYTETLNTDGDLVTREAVSVSAAAYLAARGKHLPGKPGGAAFDRKVRRLIMRAES